MKILFLSESYYPHYGGAELATHLYSKKLAEKDNETGRTIFNALKKYSELMLKDSSI